MSQGNHLPTEPRGPSVASRELGDHLDRFLDAQAGRDYGPNGLQVEGRDPIRKLIVGVSACEELFQRAEQCGADSILVHHGLFWEGMPRSLTGLQYRRVARLVRSGMSLFAYHLPLDRHPEVGNNAVAARAFGLGELEGFGLHEGSTIGFAGNFPEPLPVAELLARCKNIYGQDPLAFTAGPDRVRRLAILSGGGDKSLWEAIAMGCDGFVTGEASEWVMNVAREAGIHFLAAGHYATERLGVQALGRHIERRFGIAVEFIDVPNPI